MQTRHHHKRVPERGQILLITIMLLAAAVTVVMTIAFNSTTETQITKMEEDSQKALSAAETALEAAIQQKGTVVLNNLPAFNNTGITGGATIVELGGNEFVTPLMQRDEQYTFYLADNQTFANPWSGTLTIYLKSETPADCPALELTFVDQSNVMTKKIVDPCSPPVINGGSSGKVTTTNGTFTVKDTGFTYKTTGSELVGIANMKLLIARVLNTATRIGFAGTAMKSQGRVITSEAKTQTGVTKKIQLFQSYPQIPSDFFVTSF